MHSCRTRVSQHLSWRLSLSYLYPSSVRQDLCYLPPFLMVMPSVLPRQVCPVAKTRSYRSISTTCDEGPAREQISFGCSWGSAEPSVVAGLTSQPADAQRTTIGGDPKQEHDILSKLSVRSRIGSDHTSRTHSAKYASHLQHKVELGSARYFTGSLGGLQCLGS